MGILDFFNKFLQSNQPNPQTDRSTVVKTFNEIEIPEIDPNNRPKFLTAIYNLEAPNNYEGYFKNGELFDVNPRNKKFSLDENRQIAYDARYIISDGVKYDLENPKSISTIQIPNFNEIKGMPFVTRDLSNILKMRANRENRPSYAVHLCYKAANLMLASPIAWGRKDYYLIIKHLWLIGEIEYADYLEKELKKRLPFMTDINYHHKKYFIQQMNMAKQYNSDLIEIGVIACPCSECAKYQGRIYSISGEHPKYPPLPKFIIDNYGTCCGNSIHARMDFENDNETIQIYKFDKDGNCKTVDVNAIKYSNRPFIDDRTKEEKERFKKYKQERIKREEADNRYCSRNYWIEQYQGHFEYQKIVDLLGEKAPKSYSGYMRMKNNHTKNYQKLKEEIEKMS